MHWVLPDNSRYRLLGRRGWRRLSGIHLRRTQDQHGPQAGLDNKAALKEYQKKINSEYWSSSDNDIAWAIGIDRWLNAA